MSEEPTKPDLRPLVKPPSAEGLATALYWAGFNAAWGSAFPEADKCWRAVVDAIAQKRSAE